MILNFYYEHFITELKYLIMYYFYCLNFFKNRKTCGHVWDSYIKYIRGLNMTIKVFLRIPVYLKMFANIASMLFIPNICPNKLKSSVWMVPTKNTNFILVFRTPCYYLWLNIINSLARHKERHIILSFVSLPCLVVRTKILFLVFIYIL